MKAIASRLKRDASSIHVIRYDSLQQDFITTVSKLVAWSDIGDGVDLNLVKRLTSIKEMANSEKQGSDNPFQSMSGHSFFVDHGKGLQWRKTWTKADLDWLSHDREFINLMHSHGYI